MFIENKYKTIYFNIIEKAKKENRSKDDKYYENHHIIPSSLGGTNFDNNLILLTPREHFICHLLLCKFTFGINKSKMSKAVYMMSGKGMIKNSKLYENIRNEFSDYQSITSKKMWSNDDFKKQMIEKKTGRKNSEETLKKMSEAAKRRHKEKPLSKKSIEAMRNKLTGRKLSDEQKNKLSLSGLGKSKPGTSEKLKGRKKEKVECPHCGKIGGKPAMMRSHFDKCKLKE